MSEGADALRARLAYRIRTVPPRDWGAFVSLWMAFNAMYGGEPDRKERARVMSLIRRLLSETAARRVLRVSRPSIDRILEIPPGNLIMDRFNPRFRAASMKYAARYRDPQETAVGRLAAVGAIVYQVRCNLMHGQKDPESVRDTMLVRESRKVLEALVGELESAATSLLQRAAS